MAEKDSQDGTESDAEGRVATGPPRTEGGPAGTAAAQPGGAGEILSIAPAEIASEEAPAGEAIDTPINSMVDGPGDAPSPSEYVETEEFAPPELDGAEAMPLEHAVEFDGVQPGAGYHEEVPTHERYIEAPPQLSQAAPIETLQPYEGLSEARAPEPAAEQNEFARAEAGAAQSQNIDHAPQDDIQAPVEAEAAADRPSEIDEPAYAHFEPRPPVPIETQQISTEASTLSAAESVAPTSEWPRAEPPVTQTPADSYAPTVPASDYERRKAEALRLLTKGARYAAYGAAGYLALVVFLIFAYRLVNPPGSTLMLFRLLGGTSIERTWVPIERISPNLVRAVVVSEDGRFCDHWGIDFDAIREAIRRSGDGTPRGASTISMQVTKNLFLWPSKSYIRKVVEVPLTFLIELIWPKRRILEIYLNVAEWGPGIFGAEAAAQHHFRRPASRLGEREAALLAASLPNPVRRDAGDPGPRTSRKARVIQARMHVSGPVAACVTGRQ